MLHYTALNAIGGSLHFTNNSYIFQYTSHVERSEGHFRAGANIFLILYPKWHYLYAHKPSVNFIVSFTYLGPNISKHFIINKL